MNGRPFIAGGPRTVVRLPGGAGTTGKKQVSVGGDAGVPVGQFGLIGTIYGRREGGRGGFGRRTRVYSYSTFTPTRVLRDSSLYNRGELACFFWFILVFLVSGGS